MDEQETAANVNCRTQTMDTVSANKIHVKQNTKWSASIFYFL